MRAWIVVSVLFSVLCFRPALASADVIVIDFESFSDFDAVTSPLSGVTVENAIALTAGISLDEFDFPPHSGDTVIFDDGGPLSITFAIPLLSFGGYFTYTLPLTIVAYDSANSVLASVTSGFNENFLSSGNAPNEFLEVTSLLNIARVTITGDSLGGSFVLDDMTLTTPAASIPEPSTLSLLALGAVLSGSQGLRNRWRTRVRGHC